jgi:hypothetical protein
MAKKMINTTHIEGLLYEHKLELRESGPKSKNPGTKFIMGTIDIATDDACTNVVSIHFTYVTEKTAKGSTNATFTTLMNIIEGKFGSVMEHGQNKAVKLRIDSALALNEFYTERNGVEELVSAKRNEGGFVHVADSLNEDETVRNTFKCDMLITGVKEVEADEEKGLPAKAIVRGAIFDFRNSLMPVEFSAVNPNAIKYFVGLDASNANPTFTCVWGRQVSETIVKKIVEESAFGEASVREVKNTRKDFVITGASKETYMWDEEGVLTAAEVAEMVAARETYLATMKQRQEEYKAQKAAEAATPAAPAAGGFHF